MAGSSKVHDASESGLNQACPVGIISLEENIPCPPGTPGNPATFAHPVIYEVVRGANVLDTSDPSGLQSFLVAGRKLVERGVCAVAGNCGLMIVYQDQLAAALPVPVLLSSLLQLPFIARMYGPNAVVGIIASSSTRFTADHLRMASKGATLNTVVTSMDGQKHFCAIVGEQAGELDLAQVEAEVVSVARQLVVSNPGVTAILFECVDLPPYANAVQRAIGLPVFDITTLIGHTYSALARRSFNTPSISLMSSGCRNASSESQAF